LRPNEKHALKEDVLPLTSTPLTLALTEGCITPKNLVHLRKNPKKSLIIIPQKYFKNP
jgi:hypothetical protein